MDLKPRTFLCCSTIIRWKKTLIVPFIYDFFQGKTIESDMVLRCTGLKPNVSMTKDLFGKFEISKIALWPQSYVLPKNP